MVIKDISTEEFDEILANTTVPVILDLWAEWCHPCKRIKPYLEEIAKTHSGKVHVVRVNVDHHPEVATRYGVMGIPTVIFFKDGKEVTRLIGAQPKKAYLKKLEEILEAQD